MRIELEAKVAAELTLLPAPVKGAVKLIKSAVSAVRDAAQEAEQERVKRNGK